MPPLLPRSSTQRRTLPDLPERNGNTSSTSSDVERQKDNKKPPIIFWWKIIVMATSLIAVVTDPLFLYIPFMNGERKCLRMDKRLRTVALILRAVTDVIFIIDIVRQVHERMKAREGATGSTGKNKKKQAKKEKWRFRVSMMIHIISLLPLPQIAVLVIFIRSRDSKFQRATKVLNIFLLLQYVPNILRVRHAYKKLHLVEKFVGGTFNFVMYIVASHVIGAFWYYFSVEREISCWLEACKSIAGCIIALCGDDNTPANDTFLDRSCPVNPSNATIFDFGMFLDTIQSGYARQRTSPSKVFYYFWWGLKNLSNFGTNLQTSSYIWENCFAILISITGLLLFLYLIGNVQTYIQSSKSREIKQEEQSRKMMEKEDLIRQYVEQITCLSPNDKSDIMKNIIPDALKTKLTSDVDMRLLLSIVPINTEKNVKKIVGKHAIKKVKELQDMDADVLENMCECLAPMSYPDRYEFKTDSSIDQMLFIIRGKLVRIDNHDPAVGVSSTSQQEPGNHPNQTELDCYGSELLWWASPSISCPNLKVPNLDGCVRCQGEVEAFSLIAKDLISVVMKFRQKWNWCMYSCEIESPPVSDLACPLEMTDDIYEEYIKTWKDKLIKQQRINLSNDIETWLASTCLGDEDVKQKIKEHMPKIDIEKKKEIKKEMGALGDLGTIFPLLSQDIQSNLAKNALKRVDYFKRKPDSMLEPVSKCLKPKIFKENSYVAKSAEKRDFILFVVKGFMGCTNLSIDAAMTSGYIPKLYVMKDAVYGEHLLSWASTPSNTIDKLPFSTQEFKCFEKVEAFILKVSELKVVASKFDKWAQLSPAPNHENKTPLQINEIMNEVHKQLNDTAWKEFDNDDFKKLMKFICKEKEIHDWLLKRKVSEPLKTQVTKIIKDDKVVEKQVEKQEDKPVDLKYMLSIILDLTIEEKLVDQLCMPILNKVALLKPMPAILKSMRASLEPMVYQSNELIVEKGKSLELILLIINGEITLADNDSVASSTRSKTGTRHREGIYFAKELLDWFSFENESAGSDPMSLDNVRCQTKVEAFILPISKLRCVLSDNISEWESNWKKSNHHLIKTTDSNEIWGEKSEQQQREIKIKDEIHDWLLRHGFNAIFEKKFWFHVRINKSIEKNIDAEVEVDLEYILSSLKLPPNDIVKPMIEHLCIVTLRKVPMLQKMPDKILEKMCLHMEAKVYKEKEQLVGKGELLKFVFVIVDGEIEWTVETEQKTKTRGDFFGERLLNWASSRTMFSSPAPTATKDIRCLKKVEAFRLSIKNLESLVSEHIDEWKSNFQLHLNSEIDEKYKEFQRGAIKLSEIDSIEDKEVRKGVKIKIKENDILKWISSNGLGEELMELVKLEIEKPTAIEHAIDSNVTLRSMLSITGADGQITKLITQGLCIRWLRKVSMLEHLHEDVLKAMSDHVKAVYLKKNQVIVKKGEMLPFVLIIVEGEIELSTNTSEVEATDSKIITKGKGDVFGEELFNWASPHVMFIGSAPTSTVDVKCQNKLQAFKLTVENLRQVVYEHKPHWDLNFKSSTNQQQLEDATAMRNNIDKIYKQWQEGSIKLEEIVNEEYREAIKIKIKENDIDKWMSDNGFSEELKELAKLEIQKKNAIRSYMDTDISDMYLKFMLSLAGSRAKITTDIAHHFCSGTLKKVPKLKRLDENVFRKISDQVNGFYLDVDNFVVKKGEPLPFVLIIVEGVIEWSEMAGGVETIVTKKKGDIYGEELLDWVSPGADTSMPSKDRPTSNVDVICREKVQGFKLTPGKLGRVVNDCETEWRLNFGIKDPISLEFIADQILKRRVEPIQKKQKTTNSRGKGGEREGTFRRSGKRKVVEQV